MNVYACFSFYFYLFLMLHSSHSLVHLLFIYFYFYIMAYVSALECGLNFHRKYLFLFTCDYCKRDFYSTLFCYTHTQLDCTFFLDFNSWHFTQCSFLLILLINLLMFFFFFFLVSLICFEWHKVFTNMDTLVF